MSGTINKTPMRASAPGKQARIAEIDGRYCAANYTLVMMNEVIKLACFASEARRTLNGINDIKKFDAEFEANIRKHVDASGQWSMRPDALGNVLGYVSDEMEAAQQAMEQAFKDLSQEAAADQQPKGGVE